jgi:hypothetical protein
MSDTRTPAPVNGLAPLARAETIEAHSPTLRDRLRVGLGSLFGQDFAGRIAGMDGGAGVADFTPLGIPMAVQEGTRSMARGAAAGDIPTALAGAGEALLAITPIPGPAARAIARAPAGGRGSGGPPRDPGYRFERGWDPERGREVTRITPRRSEDSAVHDPAAARRETPLPQAMTQRAAPRVGAEERLRAMDAALPLEFPRVRLPLGQGEALPGRAPGANYDPVSGRAYRDQASAGPARRMTPEQLAGDPGNEWVQVPVSALERIGMTSQNLADPATRMSPDGATAYLGPSDVPRFLNAWRQGAELMGRPAQPTILPPRVLPSVDVLGYPRAARPGLSFEELRQQARQAVQRAVDDGPARSRWFGPEEP